MSALTSEDNLIAQATTNGMWRRTYFSGHSAGTTGATTTSGYISCARHINPITVPSMGSGVAGMYITLLHMILGGATGSSVGMLEYQLGQITANGGTGTFVDGVAMPTKTVRGTSITTASQLAFAYVSTQMSGAGTYTLTITYKNQDGVGSRTATLTIPNVSAANTAFLINPHLQAGDTGIQDITAITLTGTTGVIKIMGGLILGRNGSESASAREGKLDQLVSGEEMWLCEAGESIAFYSFTTVSSGIIVQIAGVPSD